MNLNRYDEHGQITESAEGRVQAVEDRLVRIENMVRYLVGKKFRGFDLQGKTDAFLERRSRSLTN